MCEFCINHGEGKMWYLQVKNYSREILNEKVDTPADLELAETRAKMVEAYRGAGAGGIFEDMRKLDEAKRMLSSEEFEQLSEKDSRRAKYVHFGQVLPIEDVEKVLDIVNAIVRIPCPCRRFTIGEKDARYCFGLATNLPEIITDMKLEMGAFDALEKSDAIEVMRDMDKEGLMHSVWTMGTPYVIGICNCDQDCIMYRNQVATGLTKTFFKAEYVGKTDWDKCNGCKSCLRQCQFGAIFYSSAMERCTIDLNRCYGCGVCRARCPEDAIAMEPRANFPALQNNW